MRPSTQTRRLDLSSCVRCKREPAWLDAWRGAAQRVGSMVNEKSVSHDNRVQRSDNTYIVGAFFLLGQRKRAKAASPVHKDDSEI